MLLLLSILRIVGDTETHNCFQEKILQQGHLLFLYIAIDNGMRFEAPDLALFGAANHRS